MKNVVILLCVSIVLLLPNSAFSQMGRGMGGGMRNGGGMQQNQGQQSDPKFEPERYVGIFYYDVKEVVKKIKLKDKDKKTTVITALNNYNNKINEIKTFSYIQFENAVKDFDNLKALAQSGSSNRSEILEMQQRIKSSLDKIKDKVTLQHNELTEKMLKTLDEKELKLWERYDNNVQQNVNPSRKPKKNDEKGKGKGKMKNPDSNL